MQIENKKMWIGVFLLITIEQAIKIVIYKIYSTKIINLKLNFSNIN